MLVKQYCFPTVSDIPRTTREGIVDYFDHFLQKRPQGVILDSFVLVGDNWCQDTGIYEFTMGTTGDRVKARYSFVYTYEGVVSGRLLTITRQ